MAVLRCFAFALALLATAASADGGTAGVAARATGSTDADAPEPLSGRAIYARVLENRFRAFSQASVLASGDKGGRIQETRLEMHFKDFRDVEDDPTRGVLSKTIVRYTHPFDLRYAGYLVIQNRGRLDDQFVYLPARRQTVRVNLRGEAVFGTDFSFEDVIPREIEDATYERLPDEALDGTQVYVVEARPIVAAESEYSKFVFYVDPESFVPLRTRYWDEAGVEVKELRAHREDVRAFGDVHVPMKLSMRHLLHESHTTLEIQSLVPNPPLPESTFEVRRLESH